MNGYTSAREESPGCVVQSIDMGVVRTSLRPDDRQRLFTARFWVAPDGGIQQFGVSPSAPGRLERAIRDAVLACKWVPGKDPGGKPTGIWKLMPLRFPE